MITIDEEYKTIRIGKGLWNFLNSQAINKKETYEEIIWRLLKEKKNG